MIRYAFHLPCQPQRTAAWVCSWSDEATTVQRALDDLAADVLTSRVHANIAAEDGARAARLRQRAAIVRRGTRRGRTPGRLLASAATRQAERAHLRPDNALDLGRLRVWAAMPRTSRRPPWPGGITRGQAGRCCASTRLHRPGIPHPVPAQRAHRKHVIWATFERTTPAQIRSTAYQVPTLGSAPHSASAILLNGTCFIAHHLGHTE
jgi:hypothetical protein